MINTYVFEFYHSMDSDSVVEQLKKQGAVFVSEVIRIPT